MATATPAPANSIQLGIEPTHGAPNSRSWTEPNNDDSDEVASAAAAVTVAGNAVTGELAATVAGELADATEFDVGIA